jgi:hypothetical protein
LWWSPSSEFPSGPRLPPWSFRGWRCCLISLFKFHLQSHRIPYTRPIYLS